jgi:predicted Rossmann fold nucleotide-binding protein DprA/Smf involved in DNA uptake
MKADSIEYIDDAVHQGALKMQTILIHTVSCAMHFLCSTNVQFLEERNMQMMFMMSEYKDAENCQDN